MEQLNESVLLFRSLELLGSLMLGGFLCWLGYLLFVKGVSGEASLCAETSKVKLQLLNGAPGLFFALFGAVIIGLVVFNKTLLEASFDENGTYVITLSKGEPTVNSPIIVSMEDLISESLIQAGRHRNLGNNEKAIESLERILDNNRNLARVFNNLADLYVTEGKNHIRAEKLAEIAIRLDESEKSYKETLASAKEALLKR